MSKIPPKTKNSINNECFAKASDPQWIEKILKPHREDGVGAVLTHCALHSYRAPDNKPYSAWTEFAGVLSPGHGKQYAYTVENQVPSDPIMTDFGSQWTVPKGELYDTPKVYPNTVVLGEAKHRETGENQVTLWRHQYGQGGRVFGTTMGHHNETVASDHYLNVLTKGILWAAGRSEGK